MSLDPRDPGFPEKRTDELLDRAINQVAREAELSALTLHRLLLQKAHDLMAAVVDLKKEEDDAESD